MNERVFKRTLFYDAKTMAAEGQSLTSDAYTERSAHDNCAHLSV